MMTLALLILEAVYAFFPISSDIQLQDALPWFVVIVQRKEEGKQERGD